MLNIYSIYDIKAAAHLTPFFLPNDATAKRAFINCISDPDHAFGRNPEDYALIYHGQFDDQNGKFESETFKTVCTGLHAKTLIAGKNLGE